MNKLASATVPQRHTTALRDRGVRGNACSSVVVSRKDVDGLSTGSALRLVCISSRGAPGVGSGSSCAPPHGVCATGAAPLREVLVTEVDDSVTGLIQAWTGGDDDAGDRLFSRVYGELRAIARRLRRSTAQRGDDTLDTTALVHEVYLRLAGAHGLTLQNRGHFFAVAVRASRQIISNYARDAQTLKRGGNAVVEPITAIDATPQTSNAVPDDLSERVIALESALQALELLHPRPCRVVECRYFGSLSIAETALALDISEATVKRDWAVAQAWLHRRLREEGDTDDR